MSLQENTKKILDKYGIRPDKRLGQNFLVDESAVAALIEQAGILKDDTVVEVGPGLGTITQELGKHADHVIAVEKDKRMVEILGYGLGHAKNIEIVHEDILRFNPRSYNLKTRNYKLLGAPPYYLTARLLRTFLENTEVLPSTIAFIIQKEVAEKICSTPPRASLLSISVQLYGNPSVERIIEKTSFYPSPEVASAILAVRDIAKPIVDEKLFFRVLRAGFSSPRKQLAANMANSFHLTREQASAWLDEAGIDPARRAQTLWVDEWLQLTSDKDGSSL